MDWPVPATTSPRVVARNGSTRAEPHRRRSRRATWDGLRACFLLRPPAPACARLRPPAPACARHPTLWVPGAWVGDRAMREIQDLPRANDVSGRSFAAAVAGNDARMCASGSTSPPNVADAVHPGGERGQAGGKRL